MTGRESQVGLTFGGRTMAARAGQTVAAALLDAGITSWRTTRHAGRPRGVFCGIGVCFDCLLQIDGRDNQRACLVPVRDGMVLAEGGALEGDDGALDGGSTADA
jgi:predicted molibdopterin-dependent oxidoreductase YjgC